MGYIIFIALVVVLLWYILKETNQRDISDSEFRRRYEDGFIVSEASRRNNEIGELYQTEIASQDYLDDKYKTKSEEDMEEIEYTLPVSNNVGKYQATIYSEQDRIDDEIRRDHHYRESLHGKRDKIDPVEELLKETYKEQQRGDHDLAGANDRDDEY